jgi:D-aminopeptidase
LDAITDVATVGVGHATIVRGDGDLTVGGGPVRTGVTVVTPHDGDPFAEPVFAGFHRLNGNGEMTGISWIAESGLLTSPIGLTNSHSVGVVRDGLIAAAVGATGERGERWRLPVVAETWDGQLNDINGQHVTAEHVAAALADVRTGPFARGNVGGGTGMICHEFKGGIGTSSRVLEPQDGGYTVGVLVQANHGRRSRLRFGSVPLGALIDRDVVPLPSGPLGAQGGAGSVIVVVATDAPLLPHQLNRLAQRAGLGIARTGGAGEHDSGDLFVAFSTAARGIPADANGEHHGEYVVRTLHNSRITALFDAVIEATEAAVLDALLSAETMTGRDGATAWSIRPAIDRFL